MPNVELEFNYPKIPDNVDDDMRRFLIELRHLLLRKLVGPGFINDITSIIVNEGYSGTGTLTIEAHTSDDTLTEAESSSVHTNLGASGTITLTLPSSPAAGTYFYFCVEAAYHLRINPGDGVSILDTISPGPGNYVWNNSIGTTYGVVFDGSNWAVFNKYGSWQGI